VFLLAVVIYGILTRPLATSDNATPRVGQPLKTALPHLHAAECHRREEDGLVAAWKIYTARGVVLDMVS
jgi:hypothetical protein